MAKRIAYQLRAIWFPAFDVKKITKNLSKGKFLAIFVLKTDHVLFIFMFHMQNDIFLVSSLEIILVLLVLIIKNIFKFSPLAIIYTLDWAPKSLKWAFSSIFEILGDVPPKNWYFEGFWDMIYYEVHLTSCLDCFAFYVLAINGSNQFGNFFWEKDSLNCQILERFQGSEGQKFKILHGKKFSGHRIDFRTVYYSIKVVYTYWPDLMLSVSVLWA